MGLYLKSYLLAAGGISDLRLVEHNLADSIIIIICTFLHMLQRRNDIYIDNAEHSICHIYNMIVYLFLTAANNLTTKNLYQNNNLGKSGLSIIHSKWFSGGPISLSATYNTIYKWNISLCCSHGIRWLSIDLFPICY